MNDPAPFVLASVPAAPADASQLTLHLDICRMRAELELLEARIERIRASEAEAAADTRPFVDRAQDLVERTVASLYESGRAEIEATDRQSRLDAEARLADASRRAQALLAAAREELADALTARADVAELTPAPAADVVILPDDGLVVLPGDDGLVVLPEDGLLVLPGDDAVVSSAGGPTVVPGDDVLVVLPEHDEPVELETPAEVEPELQPQAEIEPRIEVEPEDHAELEPRVEEAEPTLLDVIGSEPVLGTVAEAAPVVDTAEVADAEAPSTRSTGSVGLPVLGSSWTSTDGSPAPAATGASETVRADAAFDVWLAMAPAVEQPEDVEQKIEATRKAHPRWLLAIGVVAVLVVVALVVAAALYIIA